MITSGRSAGAISRFCCLGLPSVGSLVAERSFSLLSVRRRRVATSDEFLYKRGRLLFLLVSGDSLNTTTSGRNPASLAIWTNAGPDWFVGLRIGLPLGSSSGALLFGNIAKVIPS